MNAKKDSSIFLRPSAPFASLREPRFLTIYKHASHFQSLRPQEFRNWNFEFFYGSCVSLSVSSFGVSPRPGCSLNVTVPRDGFGGSRKIISPVTHIGT